MILCDVVVMAGDDIILAPGQLDVESPLETQVPARTTDVGDHHLNAIMQDAFDVRDAMEKKRNTTLPMLVLRVTPAE